MMQETSEGQTYFCKECEEEFRNPDVKLQPHTCGKKMNTLKQFQEEGEKELEEKFGWLFASIKVTPSRDDDFEKAKILQAVYHKLSDDLKSFLSQQTTLAYELGKKEVYSDNGANDMCEYWHKKGKKEMLEMVEQKAVKICNGDDDCIDNFTEIWEEIKKEITSS